MVAEVVVAIAVLAVAILAMAVARGGHEHYDNKSRSRHHDEISRQEMDAFEIMRRLR